MATHKRRKPVRKPPADANRITVAEIARRIPDCTRALVDYHLAKTGAPGPDKWKRYDATAAIAWVVDGMQWSAAKTSPAAKGLKDRKLALEVEEMERSASLRRGELVSMKEIGDTISALWVNHVALLHQKFEHELPPKYQGKTEVERRQLNVDALYEIGVAFKSSKLLAPAPTAA